MTNHKVETAGEAETTAARITKEEHKARRDYEERAQNLIAREENGILRFDPGIDNNDTLTEGIKIFTEGWDVSTAPAKRQPASDEEGIQISIAYTDGSAYENGTADGPHQTNNTAEIRAVLEQVLRALDDETIMTITDSKYVIEGLCFHLKHWENTGWIGVSNSEVWKATVVALRQRKNPVYFKWVKGHNGNTGNEGANRLAEQGAKLSIDDAKPPDVDIDLEFNVDGTKLSTLTQSQVYRLLQSLKLVRERPSARQLVGQVTATIKSINGVEPLTSRLWSSIRGKDISRPVKGFLWKALQNTFKIGEFWEHLGTQYQKRGQDLLWRLARELWEKRGQEWVPQTLDKVEGWENR
ncbi:ribonuclease H-like domain-containing protein [Armillaria fumosa]|nr:ribonuclease H-like domain-containing protein [Armillaria fumosa]